MKSKKNKPSTGNGDKGIVAYMTGKPDAKAAFMKLGNTKSTKITKKEKSKK